MLRSVGKPIFASWPGYAGTLSPAYFARRESVHPPGAKFHDLMVYKLSSFQKYIIFLMHASHSPRQRESAFCLVGLVLVRPSMGETLEIGKSNVCTSNIFKYIKSRYSTTA